jgi:ABC-type multidrug transport system fused ATPase/permease subunit
LANPLILKYFIDTALGQGSSATSSLIYAGCLFVVIALVGQGLATTTSYLSTNIAWTATNGLRNDLLEHCLSLDMSFHKNRTPGEMIERIDGDVDDLSNFFSQLVLTILTNILLLLGILVIFYLISWIAGVAITLFSIIVFLFMMIMRRRIVVYWKAERQMSATFYGFMGERLQGTADIRANGATSYVLRRFYLLLRAWFPLRKRAVLLTDITVDITLTLFVLSSAMSISVGLYLWSIKAITIATIYAMFAYTDMLSQPLMSIQAQLQDLQQAEACIQRTEELLATKSTLIDGPQVLASAREQQPAAISFEDVTFGYQSAEPILHNISFSLQSGKTLGILGRTGSGKTTIARLLFRLYDPQQGTIQINNIPIQQLQLRNLRQHIGMVTQDVQIFHASVRDNLTFFRRTISDEKIIHALNSVGLTTWYQKLPAGLDSLLGANGEGLSAGEAQLLAFTRVLLTNPDLIILDEASSRLDPATETVIEEAMNTIFQGRTAIIIAHRLATIQRVDDILLIEDGYIREYGARTELARDAQSQFNQLLRTGFEDMGVHA